MTEADRNLMNLCNKYCKIIDSKGVSDFDWIINGEPKERTLNDIERDSSFNKQIHTPNATNGNQFVVYAWIGDLKDGIIENDKCVLWRRIDERTALIYNKCPSSRSRFRDTNKFLPWKLVQKQGEENNFMEIEVELCDEPVKDKKKTNGIKVIDVEKIEENCILSETNETQLGCYPSYLPPKMIHSWIADKVTDDIIRNPLFEK